jgi:hypothetical protein
VYKGVPLKVNDLAQSNAGNKSRSASMMVNYNNKIAGKRRHVDEAGTYFWYE